MSGKRLGNFREGDRSEYLAVFGLSRLAFVDPFPRQEDFGVVDFLCVLTRKMGANVYPGSAFFVQVKSSHDDVEFDADAIRWISHHMDHPLFVCVVDKKTTELSLYSLSRVWLALFLRAEPNRVVVKLGSDLPPEQYSLDETNGGADFEVHAGPPIFRKSLADLETDPDAAFDVINRWVLLDADNIARRRLGRVATRSFWAWKPNEPPIEQYLMRYYFGPNFHAAEQAIVPILTALGHNYRHHKLDDKLAGLREFLKVLEPYLDDHGRDIVAGR